MAKSSILGGSIPPEQLIHGKDTQSLGPGDSSDTGSDIVGAYSEEELASDSDAAGTGERAGIMGDERPDADILPDRTIDEAGFLDEAGADEDLALDADEAGGREASPISASVENVAGIVATDEDEEGEEGKDGDGGDEEGADAALRGGGV